MRAFVRLRLIIEHNKDIADRVEKLERGHDRSASVIEILAEDMRADVLWCALRSDMLR